MITTKELAKELGISAQMVGRHLKEWGKVKKIGGHWLLTREEAEQFKKWRRTH